MLEPRLSHRLVRSCGAKHSSGRDGCSIVMASVRPITSRPAASSAAVRVSSEWQTTPRTQSMKAHWLWLWPWPWLRLAGQLEARTECHAAHAPPNTSSPDTSLCKPASLCDGWHSLVSLIVCGHHPPSHSRRNAWQTGRPPTPLPSYYGRWPDIQLHFLPVALSYDGVTVAKTSTGHSLQMHVGYNKSPSRGFVAATSAAPTDEASCLKPPRIHFNYMSTDEDWRGFRTAIRIAREIVAQPVFDPIIGPEIQPGAATQTDAELDAFLKEHLESAYHPCGTCKMGGPSDPTAVVDPRGRVYGVRGLRVVDASIFPEIPNGNLNAPTIMTAEKIADHILGRAPLQPDTVGAAATWIDPHWRSRQRERSPARQVWDGQF